MLNDTALIPLVSTRPAAKASSACALSQGRKDSCPCLWGRLWNQSEQPASDTWEGHCRQTQEQRPAGLRRSVSTVSQWIAESALKGLGFFSVLTPLQTSDDFSNFSLTCTVSIESTGFSSPGLRCYLDESPWPSSSLEYPLSPVPRAVPPQMLTEQIKQMLNICWK